MGVLLRARHGWQGAWSCHALPVPLSRLLSVFVSPEALRTPCLRGLMRFHYVGIIH